MDDDRETRPGLLSRILKAGKRWWVLLATGIGALAVLLTSINTILAQSRELPGEWGKSAEQFSSWYYEYDSWPGHWTWNPEGWVDMEEANLTDEEFRLDIIVNNKGEITGTIETRKICDKVAFFEYLLVEGELTGSDTAYLAVWDMVGGYKRVFAFFDVEREGDILFLTPVLDPMNLFDPTTKIGRDPNELLGDDYPYEPFCSGKSAEFVSQAIQNTRGSSLETP